MQRALVLSSTVLIGICLGCESGPTGPLGHRDGRTSPSTAGPGDVGGPEVSTVTLIEFADQVAQDLPLKIADISEFSERETRGVMYLGAVNNHTATPSSDFKLAQQIIESALVNSDIVAEYVRFYKDPAEVRKAQERFTTRGEQENVAGEEMAGEARGGGFFRPEDVFVLSGEMREARRGNGALSLYVFDMTITHLESGRTVFSSQIVQKQVR